MGLMLGGTGGVDWEAYEHYLGPVAPLLLVLEQAQEL